VISFDSEFALLPGHASTSAQQGAPTVLASYIDQAIATAPRIPPDGWRRWACASAAPIRSRPSGPACSRRAGSPGRKGPGPHLQLLGGHLQGIPCWGTRGGLAAWWSPSMYNPGAGSISSPLLDTAAALFAPHR